MFVESEQKVKLHVRVAAVRTEATWEKAEPRRQRKPQKMWVEILASILSRF